MRYDTHTTSFYGPDRVLSQMLDTQIVRKGCPSFLGEHPRVYYV